MVLKKSKKKKVIASRAKPSLKKASPPVSHLGSIERFISPKEKEVRVKTFIVEKPVYVPFEQKSSNLRSSDVVGEKFDSRRSRYLKRRNAIDNDSFEDKAENYDDSLADKGESFDDSVDDSKEFDSGGDVSGEEFSEDGEAQPLSEEEMQSVQKHVRSRGLFLSEWWKKALIWAFVEWIVILAFVVLLQFMKLVDLDPNRNWWIFLAILISLNLVYQKFFAGKINF